MGLFGRDAAQNQQIDDAFARYAAANGISHAGPFPQVTMRGAVGGVPFHFVQWLQERTETDSDGTTRNVRHWRCEAAVNDSAWLGDLFVGEQHVLNRMATFFGAQDIKVGWDLFDDAFTVKCKDEPRARRILTPKACQALLEMERSKHRVTILNGRVECAQGREIDDPREADAMIRALTYVVMNLGR
jgi:hypothetical protein